MSNLNDAWDALDKNLWYQIHSDEYRFTVRIGGQESLIIMIGQDDMIEYPFKVSILPIRK